MRRVLVISYFFPPMGMGGVQRTTKFAKFLPEFGYEPVVLTVRPVAYRESDPTLLAELAGPIIRTGSLDPLRLRYLLGARGGRSEYGDRLRLLTHSLLVPDNKIGWLPFAVRAGRRQRGVDLIFATAPPYTALLVGRAVKSTLGCPLVLDYRDVWNNGTASLAPTRFHDWLNRRLERRAVAAADHLVAVNDTIRDVLAGRFAAPVTVIGQGFDPEDFCPPQPATKFIIAYAGALWAERRPDTLFAALRALFTTGALDPDRVEVRLIGHGAPAAAARSGLGRTVRAVPYLPHREALRNLAEAAVLWLVVGPAEHPAVATGKVFDYLGTGKPILATVPDGEAARLVRHYRAGVVVPPDDPSAIANALVTFYRQFQSGTLPALVPPADLTRRAMTARLAALFDALLAAERPR